MSAPRTRAEIRSAIADGSVSNWKERRYRAFHRTMTDDETPFPCYFAVDAHRDGDLRYLFAPDASTAAGREAVAEGLEAYLDDARSIADVTALAVFFEPATGDRPPTVEAVRERVWGLLDYLRRYDPAAWPDDVPTDPADPEWAFCFAGEPLFLVVRAPSYDRRHSRHAPHGVEITVQPRWVFDGLGGDTETGEEARRRIRSRLAEYDDAPIHPDIGDYGDPESREWKQYVLPDADEPHPDEFPIDDWGR